MEVLHACCCGLDVHAKTVVACLIKQGQKEIRTFSTMTADLLRLSDWLVAEGCTHVAIESTGVYWRPVFNILEGIMGKKKALVAVGHSILVIVYHVLSRKTSYQELGGDYFDRQQVEAQRSRLIRKLESLGLKVTVEEIAQVA